LSQRKELRDVRIDIGDANSELSVSVDRERAAQYGLSAAQVARFVGVALRGEPMREFRRGETEVPVWVRYAGADDFGIEDLSEFSIRAPDGTQVPLISVVNVSVQPSATRITRLNQQTMLTIKANLAGDFTNEDARKAMEESLTAMTMPPGYRYTFEGVFQRNDESGQQMLFNTVIALLMIYVVMAAVFESLLFPAAIMSSVLFSILGVFWLFWITQTTFTIMASIGILVLMGVVVNNGIVMVEHINNLRRAGINRTDALVAGSRERLRPILMTMGTATLALIPLCMSTTQIGGGGPAYYPMARAIAGGLAFSTVVSLLFLPTIYALLDDLRASTGQLFARARGKIARAQHQSNEDDDDESDEAIPTL
jgi:HAE1 family hydrophobic/amphiphilic exporter-1